MENIIINSKYDNYTLSTTILRSDTATATIMIIHGMEEHKERYLNLANILKENNYNVVLADLRGHGINQEEKELGFFLKKNGHKAILEDQKTIIEYIKSHFDVPLYLFAHSMGSIITRNILQTNDNDFSKIILSGAPNYRKLSILGILLAKIITFFKGDKYKSKLLVRLTFGKIKKVKNKKTDYDWISVNEENVTSYLKDPLCGFTFTASAYKDLYKLISTMNKKGTRVNRDLKIQILTGE
ncbi:MAG: alpha/beta fold hydrolase, partial [Anaeroplasmataceae bacterium]